jgi:hypothetical protein
MSTVTDTVPTAPSAKPRLKRSIGLWMATTWWSRARRSTSAGLIDAKHPIRHARYELHELGSPTLEEVLAPLGARTRAVPALI